MRKFQFRLETVEKVRINMEKMALRHLAQSQQKLQSIVAYKEGLFASLNEAHDRREILGSKPTTVEVFKTIDDFIVGTHARIRQTDHAIGRAKKVVNKAMRYYLDNRKKKKDDRNPS